MQLPRRLTPSDVHRARDVLSPHLPDTPLRPSLAAPGALLKLECWQPTGSFKVRGALNLLSSLSREERAQGVVAASAGNHALGVAWAAATLGGDLPATLFVPKTAPRAKVEKLRTFPVDVREVGATYDDAARAAHEFERESGATFVHAFDDPRTAAGQGTIGLEILSQEPNVGTIVVPVGGGGMISGIATIVKAKARDVRIVAVQPKASPALSESLRLGRPLIEFDAQPTIADGLAGGIGDVAWTHRDLVDDVVNVSEDDMLRAMGALLVKDQVVAEASGAASVAAVASGQVKDPDDRPVACVVTGGNVDADVLQRAFEAGSR